jgi:hypothetical protein
MLEIGAEAAMGATGTVFSVLIFIQGRVDYIRCVEEFTKANYNQDQDYYITPAYTDLEELIVSGQAQLLIMGAVGEDPVRGKLLYQKLKTKNPQLTILGFYPGFATDSECRLPLDGNVGDQHNRHWNVLQAARPFLTDRPAKRFVF